MPIVNEHYLLGKGVMNQRVTIDTMEVPFPIPYPQFSVLRGSLWEFLPPNPHAQ